MWVRKHWELGNSDRGLEPNCAYKGRRCLKTSTFCSYLRGFEHVDECEYSRLAGNKPGGLLHTKRCKFIDMKEGKCMLGRFMSPVKSRSLIETSSFLMPRSTMIAIEIYKCPDDIRHGYCNKFRFTLADHDPYF